MRNINNTINAGYLGAGMQKGHAAGGSPNKSCPKQWATFLVVAAAAATTYIKQLHIFCMR